MEEKNVEQKMQNERMQIHQSLTARFSIFIFCQICNFFKCFNVSFNMFFAENLENILMFSQPNLSH